MTWSLLCASLLFSTLALAATTPDTGAPEDPAGPSACSEYFKRAGAFSYQRQVSGAGNCYLSVDPFEINNFVYRSYLSSDDGTLMVFNSYSASEGAGSTGARVFYFFPRKAVQEMKLQSDRSILQMSSGIELEFSLDHARIVGMKGGKVKEAATVSPSNSAGVEFRNVQTLILDSGFALDHDPTTEMTKTSTFTDTEGRTCQVSNPQLFKMTSDGDSVFRFTDSQLKEFLRQSCPNLKVNF